MHTDKTTSMMSTINARLKQIDPALLLCTLRSGQSLFTMIDKETGTPLMRDMFCIMRIGKGHPKELNGISFPLSEKLFGCGWGMIGVVIEPNATEDEIVTLAVFAARRLVAAIVAHDANYSLKTRVSESFWKLRHKLAAFRAA
jgi:hypothetical protein